MMLIDYRKLPLKKKLTIIILATSGLMIMVVSAILLANEAFSIKRSVLHNLSTIAEITAINSTAALSFESPETAEELLHALKAEPHIVAAAIYSRDGRLFSKYSVSSKEKLPEKIDIERLFGKPQIGSGAYLYQPDRAESRGFILVAVPVKINNKLIGAFLVQADRSWIYRHIKLFTLIVFFIMAGLIVISYFISARLQRIVSEPIEQLAAAMQKVKKKQDFSLRVNTHGSSDELGLLMDGFNNMLEQLQNRDKELEEKRQELERQVKLRTEALKLSEAQKQKLWLQKKIQQAYSELVTQMNTIDVSAMLATCLFQMSEVSGMLWGAVFLREKGGRGLTLKGVYKDAMTEEWQRQNAAYLSQMERIGMKEAKRVVCSGKPSIEKLDHDPERGMFVPLVIVAFPLEFQTKRIGALVLLGPRQPNDYTLTFLSNSTKQLGVAIHNAMIFEDLSKKSAELEHSNLELQRASRMKSDFLANMSHELRTPLNAILGFSELLLDEHLGKLTDEQKDYLKDIFESGKHLLGLINDILDLSKIEAGKAELIVETLRVKDILESSLTMIRYKAIKHNINLSLHIDESVPEVIKADQQKFKQIAYNLVSNAVKFTPDNGEIALKAKVVTRSWMKENVPKDFCNDNIMDKGHPNDKFLAVSVKDTGIGIDESHLHKIFDAFEQVDSSRAKRYKGTGLGLALCKNLVELHGGVIWAESVPGEGSIFSFTIALPAD